MLSTDEYDHLMRNWSHLKDQIKEQARLEAHHEACYVKAEAEKDRYEREEDFYTNKMADAIAEYEAAHPPENP